MLGSASFLRDFTGVDAQGELGNRKYFNLVENPLHSLGAPLPYRQRNAPRTRNGGRRSCPRDWSTDDGWPMVRRHLNPLAERYLKVRFTVDNTLSTLEMSARRKPRMRPHRRTFVIVALAFAGGLLLLWASPASGVDRIHRNRRGRVWRSGSDLHRRTGCHEERERGVRRPPPSLPGIGEQRLVRRSCPRRREDAHGGVHVRDHAETCVGH